MCKSETSRPLNQWLHLNINFYSFHFDTRCFSLYSSSCYSVTLAVVDLHAINNFSHAFNANHSENKLLIIINWFVHRHTVLQNTCFRLFLKTIKMINIFKSWEMNKNAKFLLKINLTFSDYYRFAKIIMIFCVFYKLTQFHRIKNLIFLENLRIIETFFMLFYSFINQIMLHRLTFIIIKIFILFLYVFFQVLLF